MAKKSSRRKENAESVKAYASSYQAGRRDNMTRNIVATNAATAY